MTEKINVELDFAFDDDEEEQQIPSHNQKVSTSPDSLGVATMQTSSEQSKPTVSIDPTLNQDNDV